MRKPNRFIMFDTHLYRVIEDADYGEITTVKSWEDGTGDADVTPILYTDLITQDANKYDGMNIIITGKVAQITDSELYPSLITYRVRLNNNPDEVWYIDYPKDKSTVKTGDYLTFYGKFSSARRYILDNNLQCHPSMNNIIKYEIPESIIGDTLTVNSNNPEEIKSMKQDNSKITLKSHWGI